MKECCQVNEPQEPKKGKNFVKWLIYLVILGILIFILTLDYLKENP